MQVSDELRKCVCFLSVRRGNRSWLNGTAFLLGRPSAVEGLHYEYAVTAAHCLKPHADDPDQSPFDGVDLVINTRPGVVPEVDRIEIADTPGEWHPTKESACYRWKRHAISDVAVAFLGPAPSSSHFDYKVFPAEDIVTDELLVEHSVTAGDDVMISGLLVPYPGTHKIIPVVRVGSIAAFPDGPIGVESEAILVEVRSIGGLSGSPAFLSLGGIRRDRESVVYYLNTPPPFKGSPTYLFGLVQGFYEVAPDSAWPGADRDQNGGITVVISASVIQALLDDAPFKEMREMEDEELEKRRGPTLAGAPPPTSKEYNAFEDLARKIVAVPKSEIDEEREKA